MKVFPVKPSSLIEMVTIRKKIAYSLLFNKWPAPLAISDRSSTSGLNVQLSEIVPVHLTVS